MQISNMYLLFESEVKYGRYKIKHRLLHTYIQDVYNSIKWNKNVPASGESGRLSAAPQILVVLNLHNPFLIKPAKSF